MFPVCDVIPSRTPPYGVIAVIVVCALLFAYALLLPPFELRALIRTHGLVPAQFGWPALVTSVFLHGAWLQFVMNVLFLWIFGENVEDRLGHAGFLALFIGCALSAGAAEVLADPARHAPIAGASGAVAGVMGAYFAFYPRSRVLAAVFAVVYFDLIEVPAVFFLALWFLLQFVSGLGSLGAGGATSLWSPGAGFLAGLMVGGAWRALRPQRSYWR